MINKIITIIWILDILNLPFMEILDTTIPINGLGWLLIWLFVLGQYMKDKEKEIKYQIYLIDQEIKNLKKQKKIYVDELKLIEYRKTKKKK